MKRKILSIVICLSMLISTFAMMPVVANAETGNTCTITVNYVYAKNQAMVKQPYKAQIPSGSPFNKTLDIPVVDNYTASGLGQFPDGVILDSTNNKLAINITSVASDVNITVLYTAGKAEYTVKHYYQNLENEGYAAPVVRTVEGDIDAYTEAVAENKTGFTCTGVPQYEIAADGTTIVEIYYDRNYYTVVFDVNGGINGPKPVYAKYGTELTVDRVPTRAGYTFKGWSPELADTNTITDNVTYTAQWEANTEKANYTIVLWGQNANDDDYSYLDSYAAYGKPGDSVTWDENTLICESLHTHTNACYERICGKEEHEHTSECKLECTHLHDLNCYSVGNSYTLKETTKPNQALTDNGNGIYTYVSGNRKKQPHYYLQLNEKWYCAYSSDFWGDSKNDTQKITYNCSHEHTGECYTCGLIKHTHTDYTGDCYKLNCGVTHEGTQHTDACYMKSIHPDSKLWKYVRSEEVTINADGSTVLNVYFDRTEFTLTFNYNYNNNRYQSQDLITARWGKNIAEQYKTIVTKTQNKSTFWSEGFGGGSPWTNYFGVMPKYSKSYYNRGKTGNTGTMTYYGEDLEGNDMVMFTVSGVGGYTVTDEDRYDFEGFEYVRGTSNGDNCAGAEFYYKRCTYNLKFYSSSNSTPDKQEKPKYQQPLSEFKNYVPANPPEGKFEEGAIFVGWYQNPECTGEKFDFDAHTMPANDIALYAKWVNGLYDVKTYTDSTLGNLYTYDGYTGEQLDIEKYNLAMAPISPTKAGEVFIGWFYKDSEGNEQPFSFTMPITQDYNLYPKFSDKVMVDYTIHYYLEGTTTKLAEDTTGSAMIGSTVTAKAKMGTELTLADDKTYFPTLTSTSVKLVEQNQEIIFYYKEATDMTYTVKYVDAKGNNLADDKVVTTNLSVVTEEYKPIDNYTPRLFQQTLELTADADSNVITFVYDPDNTSLTIVKTGASVLDTYGVDSDSVNAVQSFVFNVKGVEDKTEEINVDVTIQHNGHITIENLPIGKYEVTELDSWSWRYDPAGGKKKEITLSSEDDNRITFDNTRTQIYWLSGDNFKQNVFDEIQK